MYFGVVKITFEETLDDESGRRELASLAEKLRTRYKVSALPCFDELAEGLTSVAYTTLASSEEIMHRQLDAISEFCENAGFGRIAHEKTLLDHFDSFGEDDEDDDEPGN